MGLFSSKKPDNQPGLTGFTPAQFILDRWDIQKTHDRPGVYTILIFDNDKMIGPDSYTSAYAGQSMNVYRRLHNHLTGKGNGDVYADFRSGKCVMVRVELCDLDLLNDLEKNRVSELDPKRRYNITSGGAIVREESVAAIKPVRCRIPVVRVSAIMNSGMTAKAFIDGKEVGKFKVGDRKTVSTTEGFHVIEIKGFMMKSYSERFDLRQGDEIEFKATFAGWTAWIK